MATNADSILPIASGLIRAAHPVTTLVEACAEVNRGYAAFPPTADRFGSLDRVTAERHGAIRVGSARELAQVSDLFAAFGMYPVGFYDLRDAAPPVPVISTAFRP